MKEKRIQLNTLQWQVPSKVSIASIPGVIIPSSLKKFIGAKPETSSMSISNDMKQKVEKDYKDNKKV